MPANHYELHERVTDLLVKCLGLHPDKRIELVNTVLVDADLKSTDIKRVHEAVRKACEQRDKIAIGLQDVRWVDPRQLEMDLDITPRDFE